MIIRDYDDDRRNYYQRDHDNRKEYKKHDKGMVKERT
jgi:hypothetical protein